MNSLNVQPVANAQLKIADVTLTIPAFAQTLFVGRSPSLCQPVRDQ